MVARVDYCEHPVNVRRLVGLLHVYEHGRRVHDTRECSNVALYVCAGRIYGGLSDAVRKYNSRIRARSLSPRRPKRLPDMRRIRHHVALFGNHSWMGVTFRT